MLRRIVPRTFTPRAVVTSLYASLLDRRPRDGEEATKVTYLQSGGSIEQVVQWILGSPECQVGFFNNPMFDEITAPDPLPLDVPRLYLWHIPKTGGSSLREMLRPHFSVWEFCGGLNLSQLYRLSHYRLRSFRVISGHYGPTLPRLLPEVPLVTATLLRDPVEMVISHYVHWRDNGADGHPLTELARRTPLEEWCRLDATYGLWSNPQATSLCCERVPPDRHQAQIAPEGTSIVVPEDELLERALATLDGIDVVGTTDDLFDVYTACVFRLGLTPRHGEALTENVGAGLETSVPQSTRDWLLEHNSIDAQLFNRVKERLSRRPPGQK